VFAEVVPRLAVYSHITLAGVSEDELIRRTKSTYSGRLEVGSDLMTIDVNEVVRITRPDEASR
jgi:ribonuclease Z